MGLFTKIADKVIDKHLSFDNTVACVSKIKKDIKRIVSLIELLVQLIFIGFYTYMIFTHLDRPFLLPFYITLTTLSVIYFFLYIVIESSKSIRVQRLRNRVIKRIFTFVKLGIQLFTIGFSVYEIAAYGATDMKILLTIATGIFFIINISATLIGMYVTNTIDMLSISFKLDSERNDLLRIASDKGFMNADSSGMNDKEQEKLINKVKAQTEKYKQENGK